jgi:hypothetical protein
MHGPRSRRLWALGGRGCMPEVPSSWPMRCPCHCRSGCTAVGGKPLVRPGTDGWGSVPSPNGSALGLPAGGEKRTHGGKAVDRSPRMPVADELLHLLWRGLHPGSALWLSPEPDLGAGGWVGMCLARLPALVIGRGRSLFVPRRGRHRADRPRTVGAWGTSVAGEAIGTADSTHVGQVTSCPDQRSGGAGPSRTTGTGCAAGRCPALLADPPFPQFGAVAEGWPRHRTRESWQRPRFPLSAGERPLRAVAGTPPAKYEKWWSRFPGNPDHVCTGGVGPSEDDVAGRRDRGAPYGDIPLAA